MTNPNPPDERAPVTNISSIVIVHYDEDGSETFHVIGGEEVRLFIVDERAPNDRVYEYLARAEPNVFREIIPEGSEIGSSADDRHEAIVHRIEALRAGKSHLEPVK